ncbi:PadR family transcriptional regulator [Salaquimonas pukyongi]|uniref:PadR family transcriptional regulator n=1 Tax=Salaquimonas pukyongi TaxID=2712698 RepID=UPI00096BA858|nr:PadR family transcriptional regulator [Salaquimonas pukyongi]
MTQKRKVLGEFEYLTLLAIQALGSNAFGAEISRYLRTKTGDNFASSQVYVALNRLEKKELLTSEETDPLPVQGGRKRRLYRIEQSGLQAIRDRKATTDAVIAGSWEPQLS